MRTGPWPDFCIALIEHDPEAISTAGRTVSGARNRLNDQAPAGSSSAIHIPATCTEGYPRMMREVVVPASQPIPTARFLQLMSSIADKLYHVA